MAIIHPTGSLLFGVIFFGAAAVGILSKLVVAGCEELPSPNKNASLLHRNMV